MYSGKYGSDRNKRGFVLAKSRRRMVRKGKKKYLTLFIWRVMGGWASDGSYVQERMCNDCQDIMKIDLSHF